MEGAVASSRQRHSRPALPRAERDRLDRKLARLRRNRQAWRDLPADRKANYAEELVSGFLRVARGQVEAALEAKGAERGSVVEAEEWLAGPYVAIRTTRLVAETLRQLADRGRIRVPAAAMRELADGRLAVRVFPASLYDRLLYNGFTGEVWMRDGVTRETLAENMAGAYRGEDRRARVALVLGAGNVASIGPLDVVHKLFVECRVALLKLNPVNEYLRPFIEDAFAELIDDGYVAVARGGAAAGAYLCAHPDVDEIHVTGSARTHDAIVFGAGEEGRKRRQRGEPMLRKRITSELGNVSPVIIAPGEWSEADITFHAENVATQMTQNAGFNCNAAKVLVTHRGWPLRDRFLDRLGEVLRGVRRRAYYPGAEERYQRFAEAYPRARIYGERRDGVLPPALARDLDPDDDGPAFGEESFCAFTVETALPGADVAEYLDNAVAFANERLYGSLNAALIVDPATRRELGYLLEEAVTALRYGSVALNHWPALSYGLGSTTWGAYPGHTLADIQSGIGVVHNALLFDRPERSVIDGPFRVFPKPPWFVTHGTAHKIGPLLARLEADPGLERLPAIFLHALRG